MASSSAFVTANTRRMTALKFANSGVDSNSAGFITSCAGSALAASLTLLTRSPSTVSVLGFSGKTSMRQPLPGDRPHYDCESLSVAKLAMVESKRLLIDVSKQMERLDADVGSVQTTLKQAPEVLQSIGVHLAIHITLGMVDDIIRVIGAEPKVGYGFVGVHMGTGFNVIPFPAFSSPVTFSEPQRGPWHPAIAMTWTKRTTRLLIQYLCKNAPNSSNCAINW
jgi:hypothetical protein